ncbi:MAG TPA: hypothetical protein VME66_12425 [Candidatus Acidoferrales bacterium]|nr:hypothetical protein [Candidatus Acidoferrales bacterium]
MSHYTDHSCRAALVLSALLSPLAAPPYAASAPTTLEYLGVGTERASGETSSTSERLRVTSDTASRSDVEVSAPNKSTVAFSVRRLPDGELQFPYGDTAVACYNMARAFQAKAQGKSRKTVYELNVPSALAGTTISVPVAVQEFVVAAAQPQIVVRGDAHSEVIAGGKPVRTDTVLEGRVSATGDGIHDAYIQTNTYLGAPPHLAGIRSCALRASGPLRSTRLSPVAL